METIAPILLALDIGDILSAIVPILFIVVWVLSQVLGNRNQAARPPQDAPQGAPQPPKHVSDEIEAFLKQVAQQRGAEPPAEVEVLEPTVVAPQRPANRLPPVERTPTAQKPVDPAPVEAELVADEFRSVLPSHGEVAVHVEGHIGASSFAERTSRLGEAVDEIDENIEERIHQEFDHQVGSLAHAESTIADAAFQRHDTDAWEDTKTETPVAGPAPWSDVFKDPESIRRAIVLTEILRPPTERW